MIKIVHLITSLEGGGTENFLYQVLANSPTSYSHQVIYLKKDGIIGERIRACQIPVRRAGSVFSLYKSLRADPPDILHTCLYSAHQIGRVIGKLARLPAIITSQRAIDLWQKPWQDRLDCWTLPFCHAVIANSQAAREVTERRRGKRPRPEIFVVPNGVDPALFKTIDRPAPRQRYGIPPEAVLGGTLMRLHSEKGADFIPDYAARVMPGQSRLHLMIGGVGPLEAKIKAHFKRTPYARRVHFVGWEDDTPGFLAACDFFWSLSREESFPQTLVEASMLGIPWIAPQTGGVPELLAAGAMGISYPRLNIASAAQQTSALLEHLDAASQKARDAIPRIQGEFSLQKMITRIYEVFGAPKA